MKGWQIRCGAPDCADVYDVYLNKKDAERDMKIVEKKCVGKMRHCKFSVSEVEIIEGNNK
nr:MAG: hypothetical protein [Lokiarchaeota virus Ratatoskr Meg22_1012]